jgi:hypothetical protein
MHIVQNDPALALTALYSGKYRPACRMNQIGGMPVFSCARVLKNKDVFCAAAIISTTLESLDGDAVGPGNCGPLWPGRVKYAVRLGFRKLPKGCMPWGYIEVSSSVLHGFLASFCRLWANLGLIHAS